MVTVHKFFDCYKSTKGIEMARNSISTKLLNFVVYLLCSNKLQHCKFRILTKPVHLTASFGSEVIAFLSNPG